jgi:hypothetical protein
VAARFTSLPSTQNARVIASLRRQPHESSRFDSDSVNVAKKITPLIFAILANSRLAACTPEQRLIENHPTARCRLRAVQTKPPREDLPFWFVRLRRLLSSAVDK